MSQGPQKTAPRAFLEPFVGLRAARAATPTAFAKPHMVPRGSLAAQIHPGYVGGPARAQ